MKLMTADQAHDALIKKAHQQYADLSKVGFCVDKLGAVVMRERCLKDVIHLRCGASDSPLTWSYKLFQAKKCQIGNARKDLSQSHIKNTYEHCESLRCLTSGGTLVGPLYEQIKNVRYDGKSV